MTTHDNDKAEAAKRGNDLAAQWERELIAEMTARRNEARHAADACKEGGWYRGQIETQVARYDDILAALTASEAKMEVPEGYALVPLICPDQAATVGRDVFGEYASCSLFVLAERAYEEMVKVASLPSSPALDAAKVRDVALEEAAHRIENGSFLHDQAPTALFAKEAAAAIRRLKSSPSEAQQPAQQDGWVSERESLLAALRSANAVAIERGEKHGVCDQIDNDGQPYQSQWLADLLKLPPAPIGSGAGKGQA